jgi:L-malate glycosyltransferase
MGSSALRAMAFARPVVVVGDAGFARLFSPQSAAYFLQHGLHGRGDGAPANAALESAVREAAGSDRDALGCVSREFVCQHFALDRVSGVLAEACVRAASEVDSIGAVVLDGLRTAAVWLRERRFAAAS